MEAQAAGDARWMAEALALARRGEGRTRPNPPVGAVVVRGNRVVGRGYHRRAGGPHAEVRALDRAGAAARGATLYVTLEPCCTAGRTPPCTERIMAAGVARVVAAVRDPNPRHRGRGLRRLRKAGIAVATGVRRKEAAALLAPFATWVREGRPYVTLKLAVTLDGRIADGSGRSRWISCPASRRIVADLRRRADAVLVGGRTVCADDPGLRAPGGGPGPWRVVLDARAGLPRGARVLRDAQAARTIVATTAACPAARARAYARHGARVWRIQAARGRVSLPRLLRRLAREEVLHVLCEGGGALAAALVRAGCVDRYVFFTAPRLLGDGGVPALGGTGWHLDTAPALRVTAWRRVGRDLMVTAEGNGHV
ncbi:MAG: bifunctional diaminohydroxyphosphoribosylaminopyrimidine deaminase/5-amino-6-(5-phosphoribosylamino)uracil reductase RibD [Lentisphaerae bacterium]|nr:bifunctional diaminohydroxyphosphoribosylaminopyrimidine deaminase/5-amino-6-(5-phosphoribosylamino)uracil reductase RibD [Lentisphaerota bacterium]